MRLKKVNAKKQKKQKNYTFVPTHYLYIFE